METLRELESTQASQWGMIRSYLGSYLLGIVACVGFTPVDLTLGHLPVFPFYLLAGFGFFLYYFYLTPQYVFGPATTYWLVGMIGLIPLVFEVTVLLFKGPGLRAYRPLWVGFPIGFIGTLGIYYSIAATI